MKTSTLRKAAVLHSITIALALGLNGSQKMAHADELALFQAVEKWQMNRLFKPTHAQRNYEHNGDVVIYDGLKDITVERAIDENFDRMQNMMFTRVILTDENGQPKRGDDGEVLVADDGC